VFWLCWEHGLFYNRRTGSCETKTRERKPSSIFELRLKAVYHFRIKWEEHQEGAGIYHRGGGKSGRIFTSSSKAGEIGSVAWKYREKLPVKERWGECGKKPIKFRSGIALKLERRKEEEGRAF